MKKVALIGHPISHSLSPKLHNYWIEKYGIDAVYEAVDVLPDELEITIKRMQEEGYIGCNITMPYKHRVTDLGMFFLKGIHITAVNTINFKMKGSVIVGLENTDIEGFKRAITKHLKKPCRVLIIGTGGVASSICQALYEQNSWCEVIVAYQTPKKILGVYGRHPNNRYIPLADAEDYLDDIDLLINATPCGMKGYPELDIDLSPLNKNAVVFDAVYNPIKTGLIKQAEELGIKTISGLEMFLYQAQASFETWFGIKPEITQELRDLMMEEL